MFCQNHIRYFKVGNTSIQHSYSIRIQHAINRLANIFHVKCRSQTSLTDEVFACDRVAHHFISFCLGSHQHVIERPQHLLTLLFCLLVAFVCITLSTINLRRFCDLLTWSVDTRLLSSSPDTIRPVIGLFRLLSNCTSASSTSFCIISVIYFLAFIRNWSIFHTHICSREYVWLSRAS